MQNDHNIYATIENLRDTTENLETTSQLLRANPSVILWGNRGDNGVKPVKGSERNGICATGAYWPIRSNTMTRFLWCILLMSIALGSAPVSIWGASPRMIWA